MSKKKSVNGYSQDFSSLLEYDIADIKPMNESQKQVYFVYNSGFNLLLEGSAGTGKTFLSLFLALRDLLGGRYSKIILVRSPVATRDIGHLPGELEDKLSVYEAPYKNILQELLPTKMDPYQYLKDRDMLEFVSTSYIRGTTLDSAVVIVDEAQNCSFHELDSIITRIGKNSRIIFSGDTKQSDLIKSNKDVSGLKTFSKILDQMKEFATVSFTSSDIVRSGLVKSYIMNKEELCIDG